MRNMETEPTIGDVLEAINNFADQTEKRFEGVENRLGGIEGRLGGVEGRLSGVEGRLSSIEGQQPIGINTRLTKIEATMVTKDYLDEKLADLRDDFHLKYGTVGRKGLA